MEKIKNIKDYIGLPVYVKGVCWGRSFDGWTVIFTNGEGDLRFDYKGRTYTVDGFLPTRFSTPLCSGYNNAFYTNDGEQDLGKEIARLKELETSIDNFCRELCAIRLFKGKKTPDFEDLLDYIEKQKAEAVKEFAERLKKNFLALEYQANTTRKTLPIDFVKDQIKWLLQEVSIETIDSLIKEMTVPEEV